MQVVARIVWIILLTTSIAFASAGGLQKTIKRTQQQQNLLKARQSQRFAERSHNPIMKMQAKQKLRSAQRQLSR